jgi:hypothetical protein
MASVVAVGEFDFFVIFGRHTAQRQYTSGVCQPDLHSSTVMLLSDDVHPGSPGCPAAHLVLQVADLDLVGALVQHRKPVAGDKHSRGTQATLRLLL